MINKINIIGYGFVGQANAIGFKRLGYEVEAFDIKEKENIYNEKEFNDISLKTKGELPDAGINIVCIADKNPEDGRQEVGHIAKTLEDLKGRGTVILRTTVLPGLFSDLRFDLYWPEFLHEKAAIKDFLNPDRVVVGRRGDQRFPFEQHFKPVYYCSPEEASHIKYLHNIWNALRIAFVNEFGDNLIKGNINQERVLDYYFEKEKYLKWGNAFSGHCLPKDSQAYCREYPGLLILEALIRTNKIHKDKYPELDNKPIF